MSAIKVGDLVVIIKNDGPKEFDKVIGTISKVASGPFPAICGMTYRQFGSAYELERFGRKFFFAEYELKKIEPLPDEETEKTRDEVPA